MTDQQPATAGDSAAAGSPSPRRDDATHAPDRTARDRSDADRQPAGTGRDPAPTAPVRDDASARGRAVEPPSRKPSAANPARIPWLWILAIALVIGGGGSYWYRTSAKSPAPQGEKAAERGVPVKVADAKAADLPLYVNSLGNVQAFNTVLVRSRVDGELTTIAFTEGQIVQKGDILAQIDPRPYQAALDQALAKKAQDEATLLNTQRDLQRTNQLGEFATRQQRDTQSAGVTSQTAQLAADQAAIDNAETQLSYATVRAPLTGRTGLRLVDQGNIVRATDQTGIVEIAQIQPIAVLFTAPQQQLPDIADAMKAGRVPVTALSSDGRTVLGEGELALINNSIDAASGTIRLKATFPNGDERLWPGLSVNTRLRVKTLHQVVGIPADAVQRGPDGMFCYVVVAGDKVERRELQVGPYTEGFAIVEKGVKAGDRVVTAGHYRLSNGTKVDLGESAPDQPPANEAGRSAQADAR